jgi:predicted ATPase
MLSNQIKTLLLKTIITTPSFLGKYEEYDGILTFLNKIWDLREMPSEDGRFKDAYEDTHQHMVNNSDWEYEYLFSDRFKLIEGDEKYFISFIETIVSPIVRKDRDDILKFVSTVNTILRPTGFRLILVDYFEELPVYKYKETGELNDLPLDIIANKIPIYIATNNAPIQYPSFELVYNRWDDFGYVTMFNLIFRENATTFKKVGGVKIIKRETKVTRDSLAQTFTSLDSDYCSLGQEQEYYTKLRDLLGTNYSSFLLALRDVAIFPRINELFENDEIYKKSLIRFDEAERLVRTIRFEIEGVNPDEYYKFNYEIQPPYAENLITLNFNFRYNTDFESRIFALIGKNGTGKTRILSALAKNLSEKEPKNFIPRKPIYSKIFTVSYSYFDKFEIPNRDASFNYVYCGLKKNNGTLKSETELLEEFYTTVNKIVEKDITLFLRWINILRNFLPAEILEYINVKEIDDVRFFDKAEFEKVKLKLSSGQSIVLYMVTEILSNIRFDSLILFDEPETHLHPNAISALMNTLFALVKEFESFCVIATHSPLIVQELPSDNIFVIERDGNSAFVRGLERESLGENLTVITQDIFGNREVPKHFINLISELIAKGKSYPEIISLIESSSLPITSNIRLYIKTLMASI